MEVSLHPPSFLLHAISDTGWRVSEEAVVPLLDAYALCRRPGEVERVVANLDAFGLTKTPAICSSLIGSFCLMGLPRAAESVFRSITCTLHYCTVCAVDVRALHTVMSVFHEWMLRMLCRIKHADP